MRKIGYKELVFNSEKEVDLQDKRLFWPNDPPNGIIHPTDSINYNGIEYKTSMVYFIVLDENDLPLFGELVVIHVKQNKSFFLFKPY